MYKRESLILSSICHPIKFIWRFFVTYWIMGYAFEFIAYNVGFLSFLNNFTYRERFEYKIFLVLVVYITMRFVRSNVEDELCNLKPEKKPSKIMFAFSLMDAISKDNRRKREYEDYQSSQAMKRTMYQMNMNDAINAKHSGNEEAEDYYRRQARYWENM